jgi:PII-like signaling protein
VLLADELLDIHAHLEIRSSILLRGAQGFGAKHRLRSDRLLTISEDLPLVCVAVDRREQIERLLADVGSISHEGLMTLERAQLFESPLVFEEQLGNEPPSSHADYGGPGEPLTVATDADSQHDLEDSSGAAKLTVYLGRHERVGGLPAFASVCQTLYDNGIAGATVLLGVDGTRYGSRERARFFARNQGVPLMVVSVGDQRRISAAIAPLAQMLAEPLFTLENVRVCKRDGVLLEAPHDGYSMTEYGMNVRQKLTIVLSEAALHGRRSIYTELVRRLRAADAAGATSLRGIWGFHGDHAPHGDRLLSIRRHVPVVTEVIDTPERIASLFAIVDQLTDEQGLLTSEMVPASSALNSAPGL